MKVVNDPSGVSLQRRAIPHSGLLGEAKDLLGSPDFLGECPKFPNFQMFSKKFQTSKLLNCCSLPVSPVRGPSTPSSPRSSKTPLAMLAERKRTRDDRRQEFDAADETWLAARRAAHPDPSHVPGADHDRRDLGP